MADFTMNLTDCDEAFIAEQLRRQLAIYDRNPLRTWRWCSGFLWGAVLVAAMNYADIWICVGACNGNTSDARAYQAEGDADE